MNRAVLMSMFVLVLMAGLTAYMIVSQPSIQYTSPSASTSERTSPQTGGPSTSLEPVIIVDALNRTVVLSKPPEKVAIVGKGSRYLIEAAYMFATAPRKTVALDSSSTENPVLRLRDPDLSTKTLFSGFPSAEELLKLRPDLIVLKSSFMSQGRVYEEAGLRVIYVDVETPDQFYMAVSTLGKVFGEEVRATELTNFFRNMTRLVEGKLEGLTVKPTTLFIYYDAVRDKVVKAPPAGYLQSVLVEMAGGKSVNKELPGSSAQPVSLEQIITWNPNVLFIATYSNDPSPVDYVRQVLSSSEWRNVAAVRDGRVYPIPGGPYSWDMPGPKWTLCLIYMAKAIHPDRFADVSVRNITVDFYAKVYELNPADAEEMASRDLEGIKWLG
ncbi:MAG: ABC transporter substrate-binding protein [Zestosphaera sp.]